MCPSGNSRTTPIPLLLAQRLPADPDSYLCWEARQQRLPVCPTSPDSNLMAFKVSWKKVSWPIPSGLHTTWSTSYSLWPYKDSDLFILERSRLVTSKIRILVTLFSWKPQLENTRSFNMELDCHFCSVLLILYPGEDNVPNIKLTITL